MRFSDISSCHIIQHAVSACWIATCSAMWLHLVLNNELRVSLSPLIMSVKYTGGCSTMGDVQYTGEYHEYNGGYHEYHGRRGQGAGGCSPPVFAKFLQNLPFLPQILAFLCLQPPHVPVSPRTFKFTPSSVSTPGDIMIMWGRSLKKLLNWYGNPSVLNIPGVLIISPSALNTPSVLSDIPLSVLNIPRCTAQALCRLIMLTLDNKSQLTF